MGAKRTAEDVEDEAFPRGAVESKTPSDKQDKRANSDGSAKKKKKKERDPDDLNDLFGKSEGIEGKFPKYVELLKHKTLSVGMKMWGAVLEVTAHDLVISLPHGLRGFVTPKESSDLVAELLEAAGDVSDSDSDSDNEDAKGKGKTQAKKGIRAKDLPALTDLFTIGQRVQCMISSVTGAKKVKGKGEGKGEGKDEGTANKRIDLTLRLSKLHKSLDMTSLREGLNLPAYVRSVEDHGYIVSFGIPGTTGFLSTADAAGALKIAKKLQSGSTVDCTVSKVDKKKKVITVTTNTKAVPAIESDGITLSNLTPGMLVSAKVRAVLPDGLLLTFLSYFTGTVDWFHLLEELPTREWSKAFSENQRLQARILYVDAKLKRVGLTLKPQLVECKKPVPAAFPMGQVVEETTVYRIDPGVGMLVQMTSTVGKKSISMPAYVHISDASDERIEKLEKTFKPGQKVRARVSGFRMVDALGCASLKTSVLEQEIFTYDDAKPGRVVRGTVVGVQDFGLFIKLSETIKALCPLSHLTDVSRSKISTKFEVGSRIKVRILETVAARKRITVTHKKTLLTSKLPIVTCAADATPGMKAHGYVSGIESYGVFVSFYNGMKGIARLADLGLAEDQTPTDAFELHQVVKAKIIGPDSAKSSRLKLSLDAESFTKTAGKDGDDGDVGGELEGVELGMVMPARMGNTLPTLGATLDVTVTTPEGKEIRALLDVNHLSDHPVAAEVLRSALVPKADLGLVVVLEMRDNPSVPLRVSRKVSLVMAAGATPKDLAGLKAGTTHAAHVASVSDAGCFVRFLGRLTGLAPVPQLADTFVTDPRQHFAVGQSVKAHVLDVDEARSRAVLTLKASVVGSDGAGLLRSLFADTERAAELAAEAEANPNPPDWRSTLAVGAVLEGTVHEVKEYGVLVNLDCHADVVGFVAAHHTGDVEVKAGLKVRARVLDASKKDGIVDLTFREDLVAAGEVVAATDGKKSKKGKKEKAEKKSFEVAETVESKVLLVKEDYLVVDIAGAIGFVASKSWNVRLLEVHQVYRPGQTVAATVTALPESATGGRLLLSPKAEEGEKSKKRKSEGSEADKGKKKGRPSSEELVGTIIKGTITAVRPLQLEVKLANRWRGRVHITEANLPMSGPKDKASLAANFKLDDEIEVEVLGVVKAGDGGDTGSLELSLKISGTTGPSSTRLTLEGIKPGDKVDGFVQQIGADWLWLALSPSLKARIFLLDSSDDVSDVLKFTGRFSVGQRMSKCLVVARDLSRRSLDLTLKKKGMELKEGALVPGRIAKLLPDAGLNVQLGSHTFGRVNLTDLRDHFVVDPLKGMSEGQLVKCCVVKLGDNGRRIDLSLRTSRGGCEGALLHHAHKKKKEGETEAETCPEITAPSQLTVGQSVTGYVKKTSSSGCFVNLGRGVDALVRLGNLSTQFVADPAAEFPSGMFVQCRIMKVENSGRVEATLKMDQVIMPAGFGKEVAEEKRLAGLKTLDVGMTVRGKVRKVEAFGVFVDLDDVPGNVTGMCHVSELADEFVKKPDSLFNVGDKVRAKVIRVNPEEGKLYLGLKPSYFKDEKDLEADGSDDEEMEDKEEEAEGSDDEEEDSEAEEEGSEADVDDDEDEDEDDDDSDGEEEEDEEEEHTKSGSAAIKAPTLAVDADMDWGDELKSVLKEGGALGVDTAVKTEVEEADEKKTKRDKKRAKASKEEQIRAAEQARLTGASAPSSVDDFEKAALSASSSSFVWIKYIAWHVSNGETEAARKVAERALETIHFREEGERFNVWMAYLNLENMYGEPTPAEAVAKLFQKASQMTDSKKLHLGVAGMYDRTDQAEPAEAMLKAACRKFSMSAKVRTSCPP